MSSSSSSNAAASPATKLGGGEEFAVMYWCHECDMSIRLLVPTTITATNGISTNNNIGNSNSTTSSTTTSITTSTSPICPQCDLGFLELMDTTASSSSAAASLDLLHLDSPTFRSAFFPKQPTTDDDHAGGGNQDDRSFFSYFRLLPTVRIGDEEANEEEEGGYSLPCAVCREQFGVDEEAKRLPCGHLFHGECILPWLSSGHLSCPLCRFQLINDPPRVEDDEDNEEEDEGRWFMCLQSFFASSSSSSSSSSVDSTYYASTCLPTAD